MGKTDVYTLCDKVFLMPPPARRRGLDDAPPTSSEPTVGEAVRVLDLKGSVHQLRLSAILARAAVRNVEGTGFVLRVADYDAAADYAAAAAADACC